jgi:uncharacterized protein YecE (DUF72 family)
LGTTCRKIMIPETWESAGSDLSEMQMEDEATSTGIVRIGISGWRYKGWRGVFYPDELAQRRELEFASRQFNTIELNGSFYSLQRPGSFVRWYQETPDDFVFSVKGSRYITHMRRLREPETPLANFFAQGILTLGQKLGPILWQFPPNFIFDADKFNAFFSLLPKTTIEAAALMRKYAGRPSHPVDSSLSGPAHLRHAVEIRNESFVTDRFIRLLHRHQIALVVADTVEWPLLMDVTADFVYCRLHGSEQLYASGYDDSTLQTWAERVTTWAQGGEVLDGRRAAPPNTSTVNSRDVFVYFDNDMKVRAPFDARNLRERTSQLLDSRQAVRSPVDLKAAPAIQTRPLQPKKTGE